MKKIRRLKHLDPCGDCGDCCEYLALEIERPRTKRDYSDLFWYLLHKNVSVFIDHDRSWNIEFLTSCEALDDEKRCATYDTRPVICRHYDPGNCTRHSRGDYYIQRFETREQLARYLKKRGIDYEYVRPPKTSD